MADLTRDDVLKLARLARISLSDDEATEFTKELAEILNYVDELQSVDVSGLKPTYQVNGLTNVMRDDRPIDYGYQPSQLLDNVPNVQDNQIKVNRMIG